MNIYDNIECIYYINLESRVDRNNYIQGHLKERFPDKTIQRFEALDRSIPRNYPFVEDKCNGATIVSTHPGIVGCYASHLCLLKTLDHKYKFDSRGKFVLIFEDDTYMEPEFIDKLKEPFTLDTWNILLGINPNCNINVNQINALDLYKKDKHIFGTNIVIYNLDNIHDIYKKVLSIPKLKDYDFMLKENIPNIYFFDTNYIKEQEEVRQSDVRLKGEGGPRNIKQMLRNIR